MNTYICTYRVDREIEANKINDSRPPNNQVNPNDLSEVKSFTTEAVDMLQALNRISNAGIHPGLQIVSLILMP